MISLDESGEKKKKYLKRLVITIPSVFFLIITPAILVPCYLWCWDASGLAVMLLYLIIGGIFSLIEIIYIIQLVRLTSPVIAITTDGVQQSVGFGFVDNVLLLIVVASFMSDIFMLFANAWLVLSFPFFMFLLARAIAKNKLTLARCLFVFSCILMVAIFCHLVLIFRERGEGIDDFLIFGFFYFSGIIFGSSLLRRWYKPLFPIMAFVLL